MEKLPREVLVFLWFVLPDVFPELVDEDGVDNAIRELFFRDLGGV